MDKFDVPSKVNMNDLCITTLCSSGLTSADGRISTIDYNGKINLSLFPSVKKCIFNNPATIIYWRDGTKTVVKCQNDEIYDKEKGIALCYMKKMFGNQGSYFNKIKELIDPDFRKTERVLNKLRKKIIKATKPKKNITVKKPSKRYGSK